MPKTDSPLAPAGALAALADRQLRDYRARNPGTCFADPDFTLGLREAYELQGAVSALRLAEGDRVVGYKVGCTGPGTTAQLEAVSTTTFSGDGVVPGLLR